MIINSRFRGKKDYYDFVQWIVEGIHVEMTEFDPSVFYKIMYTIIPLLDQFFQSTVKGGEMKKDSHASITAKSPNSLLSYLERVSIMDA